jgi:hypothetical protein
MIQASEPAMPPAGPRQSEGAPQSSHAPQRNDVARWGAVCVIGLLVIVATAAAPRGLRRMDAFRIDHVEIYGNHFMTAEQVLNASHITKHASVFDDVDQFRRALLAQPLIATATVQRKLPNTAIVRITETHPVAFARTPELRPIDALGRILPADPTTVDMDLPIITAATRMDAHSKAVDIETIRTAAVLGKLAELEPVLAPWVSEATPMRDGVRLSLREPANVEVLLPFDVDANRLRELRVTLADLAAPSATALAPTDTTTRAPTGLSYVTRIDARYAEQVVVSMRNTGTH